MELRSIRGYKFYKFIPLFYRNKWNQLTCGCGPTAQHATEQRLSLLIHLPQGAWITVFCSPNTNGLPPRKEYFFL